MCKKQNKYRYKEIGTDTNQSQGRWEGKRLIIKTYILLVYSSSCTCEHDKYEFLRPYDAVAEFHEGLKKNLITE